MVSFGDKVALSIGFGLVCWIVGWLIFRAVVTSDAIDAVKEELDDLRDHVATDHGGECDICRARRTRLGVE